MGEITASIEFGNKVLDVMPAIAVTRQELVTLGLDPDALVFVGFLDTSSNPEVEGQTKEVYRQLKILLQKKATDIGKAVVYRFGTSSLKLKSFAQSIEFEELFGKWDVESIDGKQHFFYKQFRPQGE